MKKALVVMLAVLLVMSTNIFAQKFVVGVKGGLNLANVTSDPEPPYELNTRTAMVAGAFVGLNFGSFTVQPELLYSMKGTTSSFDILGVTVDNTTKADYFEIPVLLKYNIPLPGAVTPSIFVGPSIGFLLSCKNVSEAGGSTSEIDYTDSTKSTDFGLVFGAGLSINVGSLILTLDGRYNLGLTDINNSSEAVEIKTNAIQIMVGIGFPIK
ncbi:MAG: PorT family protein [Ignavibacteriales bacterium]|nr:PorT family protein [Ignavibacteriales bacterium]